MRLIVTGDFHLQKKSLSESKLFLSSLLEEVKSCDGIAILGDIYHKSYPHPDAIELCVWFLQHLPPKIKIYILGGNHDIKKDANATQWLPLLRPNITYNAEVIDTHIGEHKVVMKHTDVAESDIGVEGAPMSSVSYKTFDADIILLGHVHKPQIIAEKPLTLHPGSPYYINFGERTDKEKGYYILDIDSKVTYKWKAFKGIPMYQFEVDSKNIKTVQTKIDKVSTNSKVKLVFTLEGYSLEMLRRANELIKTNKNKFVEFAYCLNSVYRAIEMDEINEEKDKTIPQLLEEFCTKEDVDEDIKRLLLEMT